MSHGGGHAADLVIFAFDEFELDPGVGDVFAIADRGIARGKGGLRVEDEGAAGEGAVIADGEAGFQFGEGGGIGNALHLGPVGADVAALGVEQAGVEAGFVAEQEQSLAFRIEAAEGIDALGKGKVREGPVLRAIRGKLAEKRSTSGLHSGAGREIGQGFWGSRVDLS